MLRDSNNQAKIICIQSSSTSYQQLYRESSPEDMRSSSRYCCKSCNECLPDIMVRYSSVPFSHAPSSSTVILITLRCNNSFHFYWQICICSTSLKHTLQSIGIHMSISRQTLFWSFGCLLSLFDPCSCQCLVKQLLFLPRFDAWSNFCMSYLTF